MRRGRGVRAGVEVKKEVRQDKRAILESLLFSKEHSYYSEPQIADVIVKKTKE